VIPRPGSGQAYDVAEIDLPRAESRGGVWSLLVGDGPCRRSYEVTFSEAGGLSRAESRGQLTVHVNGTPVPVEPRSRRRATAGGGAADTTNGPVSIAAPMPGRVVKVLVSPGDSVAARQGLIVIEAMKMENELRAPRAGTVTAVKVAPGAPVEAGTVVVVIE